MKLFEILSEEFSANDPVLMALRAAKDTRQKNLKAYAASMKKRVYGKKREDLVDRLETLNDDLLDLYKQKKQAFIDMELDAGEKGSSWSDQDANEYGDMLNSIDEKIDSLIKTRQKIEIALSY